MAIKPFAIQGSDLTLGGVNLQAGTTGVVIPGVTQAVNYFAEEVDDRDGNNPDVFGSNANAVTVIDNSRYLALTGTAPSGVYVAATYSVDELDDGEIEEINVESAGVFAAADKTRAEASNMWATLDATPFTSFTAGNWTQIPFRPKIRAGEVENVDGGGTTLPSQSGQTGKFLKTDGSALSWDTASGGNANTGNFTFAADTITNDNGLILNTNRGTLAIGTNMEVPGVAGHFHIGFDGSNSEANANDLFLGDDYNYVKLPGYELNADDFGVEIGSNARDSGNSHVWRFGTDGGLTFPQGTFLGYSDPGGFIIDGAVDKDIAIYTYSGADAHGWTFGEDGGLTFPDGTTQTTAYTGQSGGGGTIASNVWVQAFETATPATDVPQVTMSVEYDSDGNIIALFSHVNPVTDSTYYSVGKYTTTGTRIWTTRFAGDFFTDGWGLAVDNAGGFVYIAGRISADGGQDNATLTKISGVTGLVEWSKKYDFGDNSSSAVVDVNAEGDPVMVGFAEGEVDRYVTTTKIDQTDGSIIWSRGLDGQGDEQAYGMAVGPSSEVVAVGYMSQLGDSSDTDDNMVVVKYNTEGVIQWQRAILFDDGFDSTGADADIDSEGNIYVCGQYETDIGGPFSQLMCIVKFNSMGVKQWSRRVVGNCGAFTSSIVVGADDHLYLSASTFAGTETTVTDIHLVLAKYEFDGTVVWQRLLDYTPGYAFGSSSFFGSDTGGSNLAVTQDYVAVGLGFAGGDLFEGPGSVNAAIAQIPTSGNVFTVGNWDFKSANFSGVVNSTASDILVANADKTDYDNIASININTVTLEEDSSNFLIGTLFTAPGGSNELVNGVHVFALESDGTLTLDGDPFTGSGLTDDKAVTVTVGNTDYWAIVNRANNDDDGVESSAVAYDSEGNVILLHITDVNNNELDPAPDKLIISKFSPTATLLWQKQIEQEADPSTAHDVCIDSNDNIIVIFNQDDAVDLGDYVNIIKFDSNGNEIWKKLYSSSILSTRTYDAFDLVDNTVGSGTFEGNAVQVISATNVPDRQTTTWTLEESSNAGATWTTTATIVGFGYDSGLDRYYYYVSAGAPAVTLAFETKDYRLTTQSVNTFMEAAGAVTDGTHIYVTGAWNANDSDQENENTFILKVSNFDGTVAWAESIRFDAGSPDEAYGMEIDAAGNLILVGIVDGLNGPPAAYVSKYSGANGSHIWSRVVLGFGDNANFAYYAGGDITVDGQNNIFVSMNAIQANASDDQPATTIAYIVKLNSSGTIQWARRAGPGPCASVATGIDCDILGNVYLSALTTSRKNPIRDDDNNNVGRDVLAIAKYSTAGAVLWQRYIEADGYIFFQSTDQGTTNDQGEFDTIRNHGRYLSLSSDGKIAVQVTVKKRDLDNDVIDSDYWESITFQIDQDGREMTIGSGDEKFSVKASRIPGKFVTLPEVLAGQVFSPIRTDLEPILDVTTPTITYAEAELAQYIIKSAPYEYVFGNDGTLTIPNDGDVKLTQTQIGWFSIFGPANNNDDDIWIRANCVDPATGDVYVVGVDRSSGQGFVARYNSQGQILWSIRLEDNDEDWNTRCNAVRLHPSNGNLVVLAEYYGDETGALILQIDTDTAQVVNEFGFRDLGENNGVEAYDFDFFTNDDSTDGVVVVGRKYDEYQSYSVTPTAGSGVGVLTFLRSDIPGKTITNSLYVAGSGITGNRVTIDNVNRYPGLTTTVRQGSGATFTIVDNGDGTYGVSAPTLAGTNYRVGHQIKVLGTEIGGATPANDCVVTVNEINPTTGAITILGNVSGTAAGVAYQAYNDRSGTNYNVGSGCTMTLDVQADGSIPGVWSFDTQGTNYVVGDLLTVAGTQFPGGTSPANNITMVVTDNSGGGVGGVNGTDTIIGTASITHWRVETSSQTPDYGGLGTWTIQEPLGGQAFVWTMSWNKTVGSTNYNAPERYYSVAVGGDGSIYAAGEIYTNDSTSNYNAVVSKFNSTGTHLWSRALNAYTFGSSAKCVAVRGTTVVVSSYDSNNTETVITKLDTSGNIKWQRQTDSGDDSSVAIDSNGDIYAVAEGYFENKYENIIKVIRFASNGEPIWRKFFGTLTTEYGGTDEYFKNGRNITLDAEHFYVSGYTTAFADDYESGFLVKLPKSGDCDGYYGGWTVQSDAYDVDKVIGSQANTFTPEVNTGEFESWEPEFSTNWWDPTDGDSYYQTLQPIVDRDGGAIEFADGTRQTTSAQQIPQIPITNGADHRLCLDDMGKHIYVTNSDTRIMVPYHSDNPLPIGFTVVIINNSVSGNVSIDADGNNLDIIVPGAATSQYWDLASPGMATLIKVTETLWFMTGNVSDDS